MTIEKIVEYVLHTPHNTNKAILIEMLKSLIRDCGTQNNPNIPDVPGDAGGPEYVDPYCIYDGGVEL